MKKEQVLEILQAHRCVLECEKVIPYGVQLIFRNGVKVSVYQTGTVNPQGKHVEQVMELLGLGAPK